MSELTMCDARFDSTRVAEQPGDRTAGAVVLRATELCKAFGGQVVLDHVSFELHRGEVVLLRGKNGSGKTTLLNVITGCLEPDAGAIQLLADGTEERFRFPKRWWQRLSPFEHFSPERVAAEGVSRMWQEIRLFQTQSLQSNVALAFPHQLGENPLWAAIRRRDVLREDHRHLAEARLALSELGLTERERSSADMVSLGQAKRVAVARAVKAGARILFLDEPLAGLDAQGAHDVIGLLARLAAAENLTLVIVEHVFNVARILDIATTIWTLEGGRLTTEPAAAVITREGTQNPSERLVQDLAGPGSRIKKHELNGGAALSVLSPGSPHPTPVVLEIEDLVVHRGRRLVIGSEQGDGHIQGVSFALHKGEIGLLQAPNGWGKTTLLEAVSGLVSPTRGIVRLNGKAVQSMPAWRRSRSGISFLQSRGEVFSSLGVREALQLSGVTQIPPGLEPMLWRQVSDLSGGERRRVGVACANLRHAELAILDEPFAVLDVAGLSELVGTLRDLPGAVLIAEPSALHIDFGREEESKWIC